MKLIQQFEACCASLVASPLDRDGADTLAGALRALADPARLRLVSLLAGQPEAEACVCNLTGPLGLSQPTVSHHLRVLTEAGILEREQRGRWAFYRLRAEPLRALSKALNLSDAPLAEPALAAASGA